MKLTKTKVIVAAAALGAAVAGFGVAEAVWTVSGSGSGGAAATVAQPITVTAVTPTGSQATLYPGGPASAVYFTLSNPNPFAVTVTGVTWGSPLSTNTTVCANANLALDAGAPKTLSISLPANAPATSETIPGVIDMLHSAPDGCQGVGVDMQMTLNATQQ